MGWYFGFKLPLIINDQGELLAAALTPGNTVCVACAQPLDCNPLSEMTKNLVGKLFGKRCLSCSANGARADYQTPQKHEKLTDVAAGTVSLYAGPGAVGGGGGGGGAAHGEGGVGVGGAGEGLGVEGGDRGEAKTPLTAKRKEGRIRKMHQLS